MKQYQIEITEFAEQDLENAGDYIAYEFKNPIAAENTVKGIRAQINSLSSFPERNEPDEDEVLAGLGVHKDYYIVLLDCKFFGKINKRVDVNLIASALIFLLQDKQK